MARARSLREFQASFLDETWPFASSIVSNAGPCPYPPIRPFPDRMPTRYEA
jgi:hypothetical protein